MARPRIKNAWNFDSAARQVDTGDFDFILDTDTDVGYAFAQVVAAAIDAGLEDFSENFIAENDLLTQTQADALYELVGAVLAHVAELDPHTQYVTGDELTTALAGIDLSAYYTTIEADGLFEAIGAAAAAVSAHEAALDPHPQYLTQTEADALYDGSGSVGAHVAASDPHTGYQKESEKAANDGYAPLNSSGDLPLTHLPDHTHVDSSSGGAISVFPTRTTAVITTASLANGATENGDVTLAAGYRLLRIETDRACRVRLYDTAGHRTTDADRPSGTDPTPATDHGVVLDYVATGAVDALLSPAVDSQCPTGTTVKYAIENRSATSAVEVTLTWIRTE